MKAVLVTAIPGALIKVELTSVEWVDGRVTYVRLLANGQPVEFDFGANEPVYLAVEDKHGE